MSKKLTFTVTKDPSVATEEIAAKPAVQVIFGNYVTAGTILSVSYTHLTLPTKA